MPIKGSGWELWVGRTGVQTNGADQRTIGTYAIYHDGNLQSQLQGASVEPAGPGDNGREGNDVRIKAGRYPLCAWTGENYVSTGYVVDADWRKTPKPGLGVLNTGKRTEILVHPGHHFRATVGCVNLTSPLASGNVDILFADSRDRIVAAIDDLKTYLGSEFPEANGQPIENAWIVIDGEP